MIANEKIKKYCGNEAKYPIIIPKKRRIIAFGDIHGDYKKMIKCLRIAKVIDENEKWIGKDTTIVQVGDQVDRCRPYGNNKCDEQETTNNDENSDIKILEYMTNLDKKAKKEGGMVISLLGNHELMNVMGNIDYVSYKNLIKDGNNIKEGKMKRKNLFAPGNKYAKYLACNRMSYIIIGTNLFVHAGITSDFIKKYNIKNTEDLNIIDIKIKKWLLGLIDKYYVDDILKNRDSLFWDRILGSIPKNVSSKNNKCINYLNPTLKTLKLDNMIIGHTPQYIVNNGSINGTCDNKLWRIDVGMSSAFDKISNNIKNERNPQVLEILNDSEFNILT